MIAATPRILVVEDDRDLRELLADELGRDVDVIFRESGTGAIDVLHDLGGVDAVVTDLDLGAGPNGIAVLRAAHARRPFCARILVTARNCVVLDDTTPPLVEVIFGKPWILGTIRTYLTERLAR